MKNQAALKYAVFWLITLVLSYLIYRLYENPIAKYGNKVLHTSKMMYKRIREKG